MAEIEIKVIHVGDTEEKLTEIMRNFDENELCTCGRVRASSVHDAGAINGHAFESHTEAAEAELEAARSSYCDTIMKVVAGGRYNMDDSTQRAVVVEVAQFLVDMLDCCEQSDIAEPAIGAAHLALESADPIAAAAAPLEFVDIDLRARQATIAELVAELGRGLDDGRWTPDLLRLMKQIEDTARLPRAGAITRYKR